MKIAVVHDYFTQLGGAEEVASQLFTMLPGADLFAAVALQECMPAALQNVPVHTSWMQYLPRIKELYRQYFLIYPLGVQSLDLSPYDLVVSSSSGYGKGVRARRDAVHVCYCHTPMRWAWNFSQYSARETMGSVQRALLSCLVHGLRYWDISASREPDHFIANSKTVADRILKAYGRHAEVIHPPINTRRFSPSDEQEDYYLILSRLVSYKRIDLAVQACNALGRKLLVIGDGPDRARLEALAGPTITFAGRLPDHQVEHFAARCRALIFPGEEDFGMVPLEIAAAGRPTIAFHAGGATETVIEGSTGVFFRETIPESLVAAMQAFETMQWSPGVLRHHAESFGIDAFQSRFRSFLSRVGVPVPESGPVSMPALAPVPDMPLAVTEDLVA
jgi:glycosyltransferase involved in cell wall biosynthesis